MRICAICDVAIEVFRHGDFGRQSTPTFRNLHLFLFENDFAAVVGYLGRATFPFYLVKGSKRRVAKNPLELQSALLCFRGRTSAITGRLARFTKQ